MESLDEMNRRPLTLAGHRCRYLEQLEEDFTISEQATLKQASSVQKGTPAYQGVRTDDENNEGMRRIFEMTYKIKKSSLSQ